MSQPGGESIRVLIIDDHAIVRAGLCMLIESQPNMKVVGEAGNCDGVIATIARERPDIILLDLDLGGKNGLDSLPAMVAASDKSRVIILTGVLDPRAHHRAVRSGAMGLVFKDKAAEVLIKAIERVHAGEVWLDRAMTATILTEMSRPGEPERVDPQAAKLASLTDRERQIISLVCEGLKNKKIGERLFISETTVRNHITSILSKLGLSDRFELALYSYRHKLAPPPQ
ncbi:MAG TPA: response regulator transcription factor [Blastocatellia bacterium]|nr:response regulator transcription factor [Blastocatellia bacterium]